MQESEERQLVLVKGADASRGLSTDTELMQLREERAHAFVPTLDGLEPVWHRPDQRPERLLDGEQFEEPPGNFQRWVPGKMGAIQRQLGEGYDLRALRRCRSMNG